MVYLPQLFLRPQASEPHCTKGTLKRAAVVQCGTKLPEFIQDLGSSAYPLGKASPFFRSIRQISPGSDHLLIARIPLDDGTAILVERTETHRRLDGYPQL